MKQIQFEIKKLWVNKAYLIVVFIALVFSMMSFYKVEAKRTFTPIEVYPYTTPDVSIYNSTISSLVSIPEEFLTEAQVVMVDEYYQISERYNEASDYLNSQQPEQHRVILNEVYDSYSTFIEKYQIELLEDDTKGLKWVTFQTQYLNDKQMNYEEGRVTPVTTSLMLRYGTTEYLSFWAIIIMALLVVQSLPLEMDSKTIDTIYTQPKHKNNVIFSKLIAFMSLPMVYVVFTLTWLFMISSIKGYDLGSLMYPLRIIGFEPQYYTLAQYVLYAILMFLGLSFLVFGFSIFVGVIVRKPIQSSMIILMVLAIGYIVTSNNEQYHLWFNPFYLTDYRVVILGNRVINAADVSGILINGHKLKPLPLVLIVGLLFVIVSLGLLTSMSDRNDHKEIKARRKLPFVSEGLHFEILKILNIQSFKMSLILSAGLILVLFSQIVSEDLFRINYHFGEQESGNHALVTYNLDAGQKRLEQAQHDVEHASSTLTNLEIGLLYNELDAAQNLYTEAQRQFKEYTSLRDSYLNQNSERFYRFITPKINETFLKDEMDAEFKAQVFSEYLNGAPSEFSYRVTREFNEELAKRGLEPLVDTTLILTEYDQFSSMKMKDDITRWRTVSVMSGFNSFERLSSEWRFDLILIILATLFFGGGFVIEKEYGEGMTNLLTVPQTRLSITKNKIISSFLVSLTFVLTLTVVIFVFGTVRGGIGNFNYPILIYESVVSHPMISAGLSETFSFMNLSGFLFRSVLMGTFSLFFVLSFSNFLSLFFRNRISLFVMTFIILGVGYLLAYFGFLGNLSAYLPTTYLQPTAIINGSMMVRANAPLINMFLGLIVLMVSTVICIVATLKISQTKELI